jgi:hypothetical protein
VALSLDDCLPLVLDLISDGDGRNLFRQYIQRYHYLGYKVPCGAQLRYFVRSHALSNRIVACLLFTSAALKIAPRDHWIAWSDPVRKRNLPRIVTNSRFLITVDGSYTNQVLLKALPPQTTLIGRIRQDADLRLPLNPNAQTNGRPRKYGFKAPTPKEILSDDSVPFHQVPCFAVGEMRDFKVKTFGPVFWTKAGSDKPLLLVVVKPLGYRLRKGSKLLYREPAFLICTDPTLDLKTLVQTCIYRWEIEVDHQDEKASSASLKHKPEIGTSQVHAEVLDRLLHLFVAFRVRHSGIDYEIPVAVDDHIRVHESDPRDRYLNDNSENPRGDFADLLGLT